MTKAPTPTEKPKKQRDNILTPPKTSNTQRLQTDLGRLVGQMIATKLLVKPVDGIQTLPLTTTVM